ncbi:hypothetical protein GCM10008171_31670 [Methylopila jiangsuensis]|uniref:Uncharacterized protein n=1 Tax=Methylopila jiangsuensis TaxID=586230 RepID=A0A9W6JKK8_9HYPH|nr:hypothetical protein [Methylopila jiangsuensis]MDR6284698.1 hypothetical protein [Methylopila jiangsuensis]GLK77913.1 hypothetical protein GCM10008171_31670 [Methylopila jiangsuensis]
MPFIVMEPGGSRSCHTVERASEALALKANLQGRKEPRTVFVFRLDAVGDSELSALAESEGDDGDGPSLGAVPR